MLVEPPLEKLLPQADNVYVLAMLAAKRARQLVDGAKPLVESKNNNFVTVSCEELGEKKVKAVKGQRPLYPLDLNAREDDEGRVFIPLRLDVLAERQKAERDAEQQRREDALERTKRNLERQERNKAEALLEESLLSKVDPSIIKDATANFDILINQQEENTQKFKTELITKIEK